jgi:hypothetical protein
MRKPWQLNLRIRKKGRGRKLIYKNGFFFFFFKKKNQLKICLVRLKFSNALNFFFFFYVFI